MKQIALTLALTLGVSMFAATPARAEHASLLVHNQTNRSVLLLLYSGCGGAQPGWCLVTNGYGATVCLPAHQSHTFVSAISGRNLPGELKLMAQVKHRADCRGPDIVVRYDTLTSPGHPAQRIATIIEIGNDDDFMLRINN
jgi:hypothetical protein